eukprot:GHVL01006385.1.p1 GENE.GHVL01006385.1~~GHVL01006385.1.p1  ORF type:complete len:254 (-),score=79.68 GHVL01006385.1:779-1450(-)
MDTEEVYGIVDNLRRSVNNEKKYKKNETGKIWTPISLSVSKPLPYYWNRYVLAVSSNYVTDVTRRYVQRWSRVATLRGKYPNEYWNNLINSSLITFFSANTMSDNISETAAKLADEQLLETILEPLPTTIKDFKNHPTFALESQLTRYEIIYPRYPIAAYFNGKPVFMRSSVSILRCRDHWLYEGRIVRGGEEPTRFVDASSVSTIAAKAREAGSSINICIHI